MVRRDPRFLVHVALASALFGAGVFLSCTDSYRTDEPTAGSGASAGGTGTGGSGTGGNGGSFFDGGTCEFTCSNDLKKVINCKGAVIEDCVSNGQACANAQCIDNPCQAAELSKSSYGCDYWAVKTAQRVQASGACFAVYVANTWPANVNLTVEYDGVQHPLSDFAAIPSVQGGVVQYTPYDEATGLPENQVAILFLSQDPNGGGIQCPRGPAISEEVGLSDTGLAKAFHIRSDYPVVAYQTAPYFGAQTNFTSATLLLPTSAWDTNYVAINAYQASPLAAGGYPGLSIVAKEDNTTVTLLPKVAIVGGGGVAAAPANMPVDYVLNSGEHLQVLQPEELTGSPIQSDKPVGVWGSSSCMTVPANVNYCDSGQQQIAPVKALGNEYAAVRYRSRDAAMEETPPWRLVGVVDGTELEWTPDKPAEAPETLNRGDVVEFTSAGQFVVRSQDNNHPFYLAGYMTGGATFADRGDPEWVNVIPPSQYLDNYVFFTDPSFPETSLTVIRTRSKADGEFADVTLDCAGTLTDWQPLGDYEYTRVDLVTGNFSSVGGCENGPQRISSALPFGVTVWGWGAIPTYTRASYAYPAGAGFQPINQVEVPPEPE